MVKKYMSANEVLSEIGERGYIVACASRNNGRVDVEVPDELFFATKLDVKSYYDDLILSGIIDEDVEYVVFESVPKMKLTISKGKVAIKNV